eukprot:1151659-Pelagomonas_calceolata.AAC.1
MKSKGEDGGLRNKGVGMQKLQGSSGRGEHWWQGGAMHEEESPCYGNKTAWNDIFVSGTHKKLHFSVKTNDFSFHFQTDGYFLCVAGTIEQAVYPNYLAEGQIPL